MTCKTSPTLGKGKQGFENGYGDDDNDNDDDDDDNDETKITRHSFEQQLRSDHRTDDSKQENLVSFIHGAGSAVHLLIL